MSIMYNHEVHIIYTYQICAGLIMFFFLKKICCYQIDFFKDNYQNKWFTHDILNVRQSTAMLNMPKHAESLRICVCGKQNWGHTSFLVIIISIIIVWCIISIRVAHTAYGKPL